MEKEIKHQLAMLEQRENVRILYAAESGSRAWGFESTDSDYDVRFIYVRPKEFYLRLDPTKDVIEEPITGDLDINGWDIAKALGLLYKSNPTLFEWSNSPVVYQTTDYFEELKKTINEYFQVKPGLYHYLNMAKGNYREYLKGEYVKAKKYFYVLRPMLACQWILEQRCPPPMLFQELVDSQLDVSVAPIVQDLLNLKMNEPETKEIPIIKELNAYIETNLEVAEAQIAEVQEERRNQWDPLNKLFLKSLEEHHGIL